MTDLNIAMFQLFNPRLCMPFEVFKTSLQKVLGRPTSTFGYGRIQDVEKMKEDLLAISGRPAPSIEELRAMVADELPIESAIKAHGEDQ